jgi:Family of unknown function (DUF6459)
MPELPAPYAVNLRLVKVPDAAPPYDCQIHGAGCSRREAGQTAPAAEGTLAGRPAALGPTAAGADLAAADPATAWPRRIAVVIVEVLAGVRPDRQLVPLATDRVRARIRSLAPLLTSDRRPRIARIVTSRPAARIVEMTVVVNFGLRSRALAMRFEHVAARPAAPGWPARPARWLCTAVEAG